METDKYIFLTTLRDRWVEGGLNPSAPDLPIMIKMGRSLVFRGEMGSEPIVDKLTKSHMAMIDAAMSLSDQSSTQLAITPAVYESLAGQTIKDVFEVEDGGSDRWTVPLDAAIQAYEALHGKDSFEYPDHSDKSMHDFLKEVGLEPSADVKGTIKIERGGEPLFRYSRGKVELDVFKPSVPQADLETAALEAFGVSSEDLAAVVESAALAVLIHQGESITVESIVATALEAQTPADITPDVQDAALDAFGFDSIGEVVDEVAFNEPVTVKTFSEPTTPAWMRDDTTARVEQLRQTAVLEPTLPDPAPDPAPTQASAPVAPSGVPAAKRLQDSVAHAVEEATTKVPAMAIALMELHDQLKEPARDWLRDRFQEVAESGLGEDLKTKGAAAVRDGLKALQQLPRQTRERALADSVMTLVKEFGTVQGDGNGKVETVYQTEGFTIRLQAKDDKALRLQDMSKLHTYVVEDRTGKALLAFQHNGIRGIEITTNQLPLNQQSDLIRAGSQVVADKTVAAAKTTGDRLQKMAQGLANLAPEGTRAKLREWQHQQVAAIAQTLTNSPAAVDSPAGKTFRGQRYQFFEALGVTRIFGKGQGEVFRKDQSGMQSKLTDQALADLTSSGKVLAKTQTATKATPSKTAAGR